MKVEFLIGKTGVGKTQHLYQTMIDYGKNSGETCLLIVPEQVSLEAQYDLVKAIEGHCIGNVEVLSFQRLAYRLSDDLAIAGKTLLTDTGKDMILRKIIEGNKSEFPFLSRHIHKQGYMTELRNLMSEFSRYGIDQAATMSMLEALDEGLLKYKLGDLTKLYQLYSQWMSDRYMSGDNLMERLLKVCQTSTFLQNARIFIDGFYGYTPIQYQLIKKLMTTAKSLTMTLTVDPLVLEGQPLSEHDLYQESYVTYNHLSRMAYDIPEGNVAKIVLDKSGPVAWKSALRDSLFQYPYKVYSGPTDQLFLAKGSTLRQELSYVRDQMLHLVRDEGYSYRDMVILTGQMEAYRLLFGDVLAKAEIPYYLDEKNQASTNDGMRFILSLVNVYKQSMDYDTVFEYLKSDYGFETSDMMDHLENYVIKYGIRGWKKWTRPWDYRIPGCQMASDTPGAKALRDGINGLRESIVDQLTPYRIKGAHPIQDHVKNLYQLLVDHRFEEKLQEKSDRLRTKGRLDEARIYGQIYKKSMDLLDQLCELGGGEPITTKAFYQLLKTGIEAMELGHVPASVDQVIVGDLIRSRIRSRKVCFIIGVNEGVVPRVKDGAGLITDDERLLLAKKGMNLAPTARHSLFREQFYIYMALLGFGERLYLSYTTANEEGKASRPSHVIHMIKAIVKGLVVLDLDKVSTTEVLTPAIAYEYVIQQLMYGESKTEKAMQWLEEQAPWRDKLSNALKVRAMNPLDRLTHQNSLMLYGPSLNNSITRLEQFAQCPFAHFMSYGLQAKERESFEITMPHLGMIFHRAIELFSKRLLKREMDWSDMTQAIREQWVQEIMEEILGDDAYQVFYANERNRYRIKRIQAMVNKALWVIGHQISSGDFRPLEAEWRFDGNEQPLACLNVSLKQDRKMALRGTIDRVDHLQIEGIDYVTVVDYKSSTHDFELDQFLGGIQLQLVVYMNAACETRENKGQSVQSAGMFYFKIDDPFISGNKVLEQSEHDRQVLGQMRLKGVVLDDPKVIQSLDKMMSGKSSVIPVTRKKDGDLSKQSKTITEDDFQVVREYGKIKVEAIGNAIVDGEIKPQPYRKGTRTACDYCQYKSVCQFDERLESYQFREIDTLDKETVLNKIREALLNKEN